MGEGGGARILRLLVRLGLRAGDVARLRLTDHVLVDALAAAWTCLQCSDREGVTKLVQGVDVTGGPQAVVARWDESGPSGAPNPHVRT